MYETLIQLSGDCLCTGLRVLTEEAILSRWERKTPYRNEIKGIFLIWAIVDK